MEQVLKERERERVIFRARTGHKGPEGELRYIYTLSLTLALDGIRWTMPRPGCFVPGKRHPVPIVQEAGWALGLVWKGH